MAQVLFGDDEQHAADLAATCTFAGEWDAVDIEFSDASGGRWHRTTSGKLKRVQYRIPDSLVGMWWSLRRRTP